MATCTVTLTIEDGGTAREGVIVRAHHLPMQRNVAQTVVLSRVWKSATTDVDGIASITLEQGAKARLICEDAGIDVKFTVPQQATYNLAEEDLCNVN